jgi:hypothetical protein
MASFSLAAASGSLGRIGRDAGDATVTDEREVTGWTILGTEYLEQPYLEMSRDGRHVAIERENSRLVVRRPEFVDGPDAYLLVAPGEMSE